jgi:CheY-like chemotaxis protein
MTAEAGRPIRVVVEDDARYRASLEVLLRHSAEVESSAAPTAALDRLTAPADGPQATQWDLVLMDLPGMSGVECTRRLKAVRPAVPVVVLTVFEDRTSIIEAICAGGDGPQERAAGDPRAARGRVRPLGGARARARAARSGEGVNRIDRSIA